MHGSQKSEDVGATLIPTVTPRLRRNSSWRVKWLSLREPCYARSDRIAGGCGVLTAAGHFGDVVGIKALITFPAVTAACVALLVATLSLQMAPGRGPAVRALVHLGRISYGLYVLHALFILMFGVPSSHAPLARLMRAMAALLATIVVAAVSYHWFERPCGSRRVSRTSVRARPV